MTKPLDTRAITSNRVDPTATLVLSSLIGFLPSRISELTLEAIRGSGRLEFSPSPLYLRDRNANNPHFLDSQKTLQRMARMEC